MTTLIAEEKQPITAQRNEQKKFIRVNELFAMLLVSSSTGKRLLTAGAIGPRPIKLGAGTTARFDAAEVNAWLSNRDEDGQLYDANHWPAIWASMQQK